MEADIILSHSHGCKEKPVFVFHDVRSVKIVVLTSVMYDNQPWGIRLKNRFQLLESYGKVGVVWHFGMFHSMAGCEESEKSAVLRLQEIFTS